MISAAYRAPSGLRAVPFHTAENEVRRSLSGRVEVTLQIVPVKAAGEREGDVFPARFLDSGIQGGGSTAAPVLDDKAAQLLLLDELQRPQNRLVAGAHIHRDHLDFDARRLKHERTQDPGDLIFDIAHGKNDGNFRRLHLIRSPQ